MRLRLAAVALLAGTAAVTAGVWPAAMSDAMRHDDPMTYFQKLVPVFQHPRCLNCHGAVNLTTGLGHPGGAMRPNRPQPPGIMLERVVDCDDCHTESPPRPHDWKLAPPFLSFVGKDARALCTLQADFAMSQGVDGYIHHLETDTLIGIAFEGTAAGPIDPAVKPPMTKTEFLEAAREWLNAGNGSCVEEGAIRETRQIVANEAWSDGPGHSATLRTSGRREVTIYKNGRFTAHAKAQGESVLRQVIEQDGCRSTILQTSTYNGMNSGPATVQTKVEANGEYTIKVTGPSEKYVEVSTGNATSNCPIVPMVQGPDSTTLEWPAWTVTIKGRLPNPRDRSRLFGVATRTMVDQPDVERGAGSEQPPEENHTSFMNLSRKDGTSIPIEITTDWNLLYGR